MTPSNSLTLAPPTHYYMPLPTLEKLLQCPMCLRSHGVRLLVSETYQDRLIKAQEKNVQTREAECQPRPPWNRSSQSPATSMSAAYVFNTDEVPLSTDVTICSVPVASESEKTPAGVYRPYVLRRLYQRASSEYLTTETT